MPVGRVSSGRPAPVRSSTTAARPAPARPAAVRPAAPRSVAPQPVAPQPVTPSGPGAAATGDGGAAGGAPPRTGTSTARPAGDARGHRRRLALVAAVVAVALLAWPIGLLVWANGKIQHVDALTATPDTPGTTYLLAGSDSRGGEGGIAEDGTEGARTDTIMVLHVPPSGPAALISLPRDTLTQIPGQGAGKLNAAYSWGGAPLLVQSVEGLTGLHVDHYVEVGLGGVSQVVDAVGGVELCLDPAVNQVSFPLDDPDSGLTWAEPGCQVVDGRTALAFARMRKADREGDIGRAKRQQQLIAALSSTAAGPSLVVNPLRQVSLVDAGLGALQVSERTGIIDLARLALAFRSATGPDGIRGTPPIADADYRPGGLGSTVLLDPDAAPGFFTAVMNGTLPAGPVGGLPTG
nr:LCP family protein [uncultured Cellulomonas sp.]